MHRAALVDDFLILLFQIAGDSLASIAAIGESQEGVRNAGRLSQHHEVSSFGFSPRAILDNASNERDSARFPSGRSR